MKRQDILNYRFKVKENKKLRVIIDTDAACEADDQYAIVHALLTPKFDIRGIIAEQFGGQERRMTVAESLSEVHKLLKLMDIDDIPAVMGAEYPLSDENDSTPSDGAEMIIREALSGTDKLYVLCQGAVTNVALALNRCPEITDKIVVIWIGGGAYPNGGWEFNLTNDPCAANVLFKSNVELWQIPMDCYMQMQVGYAELEAKAAPCGEVGKYLFEEMQTYGQTEDWTNGESWVLGDSPAIGLAINHNCGHFTMKNAPIADTGGFYVGETPHLIRVYDKIDSRYILEDFFAKLKLIYGNNA